MGYIGNKTSNSYTSLDKQTITGNGGASYTLDHAVANEQEIEVFVNNVRQEPSVAYTVSGTALTMTGNVAASDDFYVVFQGKAIQTTSHPEGHDLKARDGTFSGNLDVTGNVETDSYIISGTTSTSFSPVQITSSTSGIGELRFADTTANAGYIKYEHSTDNMILATNATERLRVTANGLTFNGDTAAANALDDYEEGTFTAQFNAVTRTNTDTIGKYVKIGRMVFIQAKMTVSSIDNTDTSGVQFTCPFSSEGSTGGCFFTYDSSNTTLFDSNHSKVHGARMTGAHCVLTESDGSDLRYSDACQTSGTFRFALAYETT